MTAEAKKAKPRGLGRGLNALFDDEETFAGAQNVSVKQPEEGAAAPAATRGRQTASVDQLQRNESQPRTYFKEEAIDQLAESLKEHGMIQPIVVRKVANGKFEIIAGERRWRAAQRAQLHEVPISIVEMEDKEVLEVALIENLQREDLNPVEEALGYQRLIDEHGMTQEEISKSIGKSRPHIANTVRLLNLPAPVLKFLETGELSAGHARALITAKNPEELAREIVSKGLNVRAAEQLANGQAGGGSGKKGSSGKGAKSGDTLAVEKELTDALGMRVKINAKSAKSGTLKIEYKSLDQMDDLITRLSKSSRVILGD
jgi:ParB family transcriptional regulator, chromosome partitioning protein